MFVRTKAVYIGTLHENADLSYDFKYSGTFEEGVSSYQSPTIGFWMTKSPSTVFSKRKDFFQEKKG